MAAAPPTGQMGGNSNNEPHATLVEDSGSSTTPRGGDQWSPVSEALALGRADNRPDARDTASAADAAAEGPNVAGGGGAAVISCTNSSSSSSNGSSSVSAGEFDMKDFSSFSAPSAPPALPPASARGRRIARISGETAAAISSQQVVVDLKSICKELVENALDAGATSIGEDAAS